LELGEVGVDIDLVFQQFFPHKAHRHQHVEVHAGIFWKITITPETLKFTLPSATITLPGPPGRQSISLRSLRNDDGLIVGERWAGFPFIKGKSNTVKKEGSVK